MDTKKQLERVKKEAGPQLLQAAAIFFGICGAHVAKKNIPFLNSFVGDGITATTGAAISIGVPAEEKEYSPMHFVKGIGLGMTAYGLLSGVSRIGAPVVISGIKGLGALNVPQPVKDAINKFVPQLNGVSGLGNAQVIPMYPDKNGTYQSRLNGNTIQFPKPTPANKRSALLGLAV